MSALCSDLAAALDPGRTFTAAIGADPEPWQREVLLSDAPRQMLLTARQVGKSTVTAVTAAQTALYEPGSLALVVSPSQRQSDETLAKVRTVVRRVMGAVSGNASELRTESGSRVVSLPATESTTRGFSAARLLIFDEAARVPDDVYVGALPMVAADGRVVALSTPGARVGWFYEAWTSGIEDWQRHRVTAAESARYTAARVAELRRALGGRQFRAEYNCEFVGLTESAFDPDRVERAFTPAVMPLFGGAA